MWRGARRDLEAQGHDVSAAFDWEEDPGDEEILETAHREGRILITLDKDFGELAIIHGRPHSGILRLVDISAKLQGPLSQQILSLHGEELLRGAIITAEPGRLRVRPPETP
jgi:predicted nuclease of predicted toxin-antitoxin system